MLLVHEHQNDNSMGLFNLFSKKSTKPYKDESLNKIYELLFCDNVDLYKSEEKSFVYPWDILLSDTPDVIKLKEITVDKELEARPRILAYNLLLANGVPPNENELLGVIVEVSLPQGLEVLAAFEDGTARYINHSEKLLVWETQTEQSNELIDKLFLNSINVVNQTGPWVYERKPFPSKGMLRLTFLVSNGLYFGEGPLKLLESDQMAGPVFGSAAELMGYLTQQVIISNIATTIEKIIKIPRDFHTIKTKSWNKLLQESGYFDLYEQIKEDDIAQILKKDPAVISEWLQWSSDSRSSGWYMTKGDDGWYFVGHWPEGKEFDELSTTDECKACAYFIRRKIERSR